MSDKRKYKKRFIYGEKKETMEQENKLKYQYFNWGRSSDW